MDKLTVLNNALINTGNNSLNALYDGTDEWIVADAGFNRAVKFLIARHNWPFARTVEAMTRLADSENKSQRFRDNCFRVPDCLHLVEIYHDGVITTDYEVNGNVLSCPFDGAMFATVIRAPADASWHPLAEEILTKMVEAACLRGLNEDFTEASRRWAEAEGDLQEMRPRVDQVNPARNMFKSPSRLARTTRRI